MAEAIKLYPQLTRVVSHFKKYDLEVPKSLLEVKAKKPDLSDFPYPLPLRKRIIVVTVKVITVLCGTAVRVA